MNKLKALLMKLPTKLLILAAVLVVLSGAMLLWFRVGQQDARMLSDARRVRTLAERDAMVAKYRLRLQSTDSKARFYARLPLIYEKSHRFQWYFDGDGKYFGYSRHSRWRVFNHERFSDETYLTPDQ